ncbi:PAS domain-containing sensor histidine kinase [Sulfitobacter guttiformis]|uniref:histidine kinase n=1 Tax=Sulfitobacter guttiformis TaxID=74349 RepID=A0A420DJL6_9RHOB|nr:PAS domain-containing sensor histidine kinase [Sulfitobacter guttiformis]KIN71782.1 putative sensor protein [Sulfitobacter guttiformis KCTC 32187]RKE94398.1 PAS domain S-box-containing protein [Sulfitobacter guttiformis]
MSCPDPIPENTPSDVQVNDSVATYDAAVRDSMPTVDRVMGLMPGFVYVFNHQTYSNDYTNRSVGLHLGFTSEEIRAFGAEMMMHIVHVDDHAALGTHMVRIGNLTGEDTATLEYRVITKHGEERWLRSVDAVFDRAPDGSVLRHIGCATDVTAEKRSELRLAELNVELEKKVAERTSDLAALNGALESRIAERTFELQDAVDELEQLTYIATHDLKVPVNNLCRLGLMLGESAHLLAADQAEQVGWINDCAGQLSAKIQGLVLVAQIRLSSVLPAEQLNLRAAVVDAVSRFEKTLVQEAVAINIDPSIIVNFARFELNSILSSLIDNSVKYADPDRPLRVTFTADQVDGAVSLVVRDNGTGLDADRDREKVFGLFQRAHKVPAGSGISLYCARRMLLRRGGDMTVSGRRGHSAAFHVEFSKYY